MAASYVGTLPVFVFTLEDTRNGSSNMNDYFGC